jgi:prepilin-type N-terminal cleavage/methylation domain-containing protein
MKNILRKIQISRQRGFTLVEVLIALALTGTLASIIVMCMSQLLGINYATVNRMTAIKQTEYVIDNMRPDIQMGQQISLSDLSDPNVFLAIYWMDWETSSQKSIKYSWDSTTHQLRRLSSDGSSKIIAENIASRPAVTQNYLDVDHIKFNWKITIDSTVDNYKTATESRTFVVKPRSGS